MAVNEPEKAEEFKMLEKPAEAKNYMADVGESMKNLVRKKTSFLVTPTPEPKSVTVTPAPVIDAPPASSILMMAGMAASPPDIESDKFPTLCVPTEPDVLVINTESVTEVVPTPVMAEPEE